MSSCTKSCTCLRWISTIFRTFLKWVKKSFWILSLSFSISAAFIIHVIIRFNEDIWSSVLHVNKEYSSWGSCDEVWKMPYLESALRHDECHHCGPHKSAVEEITGCEQTSVSFSFVRPYWVYLFWRVNGAKKNKKKCYLCQEKTQVPLIQEQIN